MIKHEIRWEYILVICIILGTLPCNAQSVIPMPKEMVMGEGSWDVSADTRINYSNDAPVSYTHLTLPTNSRV